jgi:REP element-mobilizing transposase RayT
MSGGWKIEEDSGLYFVTMTVVHWADLFIRREYKEILIDHFKDYKNRFGLQLHAYVIMTNHVHAILSIDNPDYDLRLVIGWWKQFTAKAIYSKLLSEGESRKVWMFELFQNDIDDKNKEFQIWQKGYHPIRLISSSWINQKLNYIHQNPVKEGWVDNPEDYTFSSARNYLGRSGVINIEKLDLL